MALLPEFAAQAALNVRRIPVGTVPEFTVYLAASRKRRASAAVRAFVNLALSGEQPGGPSDPAPRAPLTAPEARVQSS
ncbi:hypothetical protein JF66_20135 [Cryobacterium sp. MLB-32]|nr:hypothetical protein JF66_20135 [Cryobacterium sp. MLB-32]